MSKLTDVQIRHWIKAGKSVAQAQGEVPGLTFTLSAKGTATWVLRYRFGGKQRELTLGRYPDFSIATAKREALDARVRIEKGEDAARAKQVERIERAAAKTLKDLAADYMEKKFPSLAANTVKQRRHHIEDVILPKLGVLASKGVTTGDVVSLIEAVGKKSVNVAELVFTAINEIFKHGIASHVVTANPCAGITVSAICGTATPRERLKLSEAELRAILPALPSIGAENALAVKVLLATGVRINELARARWEHLDFAGDAQWFQPDGERIEAHGPKWMIPMEHAKTGKKSGRHFVIPLTPTVAQWLHELHVLACGSPFVLPARQSRRTQNAGGETFFEQRALNAMLHKLCSKLGDKTRRFTPHDLRSTMRSHLSALGIGMLVAERILNHSLGGLAGIYDQHDYMTERRAALELWSAFLVACESGTEWAPTANNVIPIRASA